ncbi:hypothetical protein BDN71DRAFT_1510220 [Pleurotus eryngii]|uniref:Uncharacterized protein n=1 Tax=Pleurotus eryngii TaxID=5323 RepID=A0A9P5ZQ89_PLEER|nr:hypothetical protein BDN71DRAFT_1510220 [Pleurotus eryngii]
MPAPVPSTMQSEDHIVVAGGPAVVVGAPDNGQSPRCGREVVESGGGTPNRTSTIGSVREVPPRSGGLFLDGMDIVLNFLKNGGAAAPLPYVKETAGVLLQILNSIQAVRDNQDAFKRLVDQAGRILFSITREVDPREVTGEMESALKKINDIVCEIKELSDVRTKRGKVRRFLGAGSDKVEIARLRDELNVAMQIFGASIFSLSAQYK